MFVRSQYIGIGPLIGIQQMSEIPVDTFIDGAYPHRYWNIAIKKGYGTCHSGLCFYVFNASALAGTVVFSKIKPLKVSYLLPGISTPDLVTGRLVILEFDAYYLVATYVPNAGSKLKVKLPSSIMQARS